MNMKENFQLQKKNTKQNIKIYKDLTVQRMAKIEEDFYDLEEGNT